MPNETFTMPSTGITSESFDAILATLGQTPPPKPATKYTVHTPSFKTSIEEIVDLLVPFASRKYNVGILVEFDSNTLKESNQNTFSMCYVAWKEVGMTNDDNIAHSILEYLQGYFTQYTKAQSVKSVICTLIVRKTDEDVMYKVKLFRYDNVLIPAKIVNNTKQNKADLINKMHPIFKTLKSHEND